MDGARLQAFLVAVLSILQVAAHREQVEGQLAEEEQDFAALANALVVKDAEQYYRNMYFGGETKLTPLHSIPRVLQNAYLSFGRSLACLGRTVSTPAIVLVKHYSFKELL